MLKFFCLGNISDLLIFGTSTLAKLAFYYATHDMGLNVKGFVVNQECMQSKSEKFQSLPIFSWENLDQHYFSENFIMYVAIGYRSMRSRAKVYEIGKTKALNLTNIIANNCFIADDVELGDNNFIMPGVIIEPGVKLGSNNVVYSNSTICHDTKVGDHNFIAGNVTIGGEATIGNLNFIGLSSTVLHRQTIGDEVLIGAQTLLRTNAESLSHYHGSPGRKIKLIHPAVGVCVS